MWRQIYYSWSVYYLCGKLVVFFFFNIFVACQIAMSTLEFDSPVCSLLLVSVRFSVVIFFPLLFWHVQKNGLDLILVIFTVWSECTHGVAATCYDAKTPLVLMTVFKIHAIVAMWASNRLGMRISPEVSIVFCSEAAHIKYLVFLWDL